MNTDTTTTAARRAHHRVGAAAGATFLALLALGLLNSAGADDVSDFIHRIAVAALPVAIGLVALALAAWGALAAQLEDADTIRLARTYLAPLSTWALVAIGVHALALVAAGDATGLSIALGLALAAGAVALRLAPEPQQQTAAPTPPPRAPRAPRPRAPEPAPLPTGPVAPTDGPLWAGPRDARRPRESATLWHG